MYRAARKSDALLTGAPLPTLFYFALPIILGNIFQQLYSIVDAIVVGKFLGDLPLAARAGKNEHGGQREQARQHDLPDLCKNVRHKNTPSCR